MPLWKLAYLSTRNTDESNIAQIAEHSEQANRSLAVSGGLLYDRRSFIQLLEGERPALAELMLRISIDPRHSDIRYLALERDDIRWFTQWYMRARPAKRGRGPIARRYTGEEFPDRRSLLLALSEEILAATRA